MYKFVEPYFDVTDELRSNKKYISEMSRDDHGFLCGMIKEIRPKKIVEIGVAEGGTTALILQTCMKLGIEPEVISIDFNENLYYDASLKTGYYLEKLNIGFEKHKFLLGNTVAGFVKELREDIDLVVIDTTHCLPGEVLDFLVVYPHLSPNATVILHDLNVNYVRAMTPVEVVDRYFDGYKEFDAADAKEIILNNSKDSIATKLLYSVVNGDKFLNLDKGLPDIGAFKVNDRTEESIEDLFFVLSCTWAYVPEIQYLEKYRELFREYYSSECIRLFDCAVESNKEMKKRFEAVRNNG